MPTLAPPLIPRKLDSREEKLDTLLTHYTDAQETLQLGDGPSGDSRGDRLLLMPMVWNMSYRTLEKLLGYMRAVSDDGSPGFRAQYFHLCSWYIKPRAKRVPLMRRDKKGRPYQVVTGNGPQFELRTVREGNPLLVLEGLVWLAGHFPGEVYLPSEFLPDQGRRAA